MSDRLDQIRRRLAEVRRLAPNGLADLAWCVEEIDRLRAIEALHVADVLTLDAMIAAERDAS